MQLERELVTALVYPMNIKIDGIEYIVSSPSDKSGPATTLTTSEIPWNKHWYDMAA